MKKSIVRKIYEEAYRHFGQYVSRDKVSDGLAGHLAVFIERQQHRQPTLVVAATLSAIYALSAGVPMDDCHHNCEGADLLRAAYLSGRLIALSE